MHDQHVDDVVESALGLFDGLAIRFEPSDQFELLAH